MSVAVRKRRKDNTNALYVQALFSRRIFVFQSRRNHEQSKARDTRNDTNVPRIARQSDQDEEQASAHQRSFRNQLAEFHDFRFFLSDGLGITVAVIVVAAMKVRRCPTEITEPLGT